MITNEAIREIAGKLLVKTRAKQVNWTHSDEDDTGVELHLPNSTVEMRFASPDAEPDRVTMTLSRAEDGFVLPVAEVTAEEGDSDWELYRSLYDAASRIVYKWDQVLDELSAAVNAAGPIGQDR